MACAICEVRRPRRYCPGVRGEICTICCGTEREVTVDCPFDCIYLQDARMHEKPAEIDPAQVPNQDIQITESFLRDNETLLVFLAQTIMQASLEVPGIIDYDIREALEALIRTYRTLESGVYYETRPANPLANHVCNAVQRAAQEYRQREREQGGVSKTRTDAGGGAGGDQVTRHQGHAVTDEAHQFRDRKDHIRGAAPLAQLPVDGGGERELLRVVDLIGGHQVGTHRAKAVVTLRAEPLALRALDIARSTSLTIVYPAM
jgi:hypothetical protein